MGRGALISKLIMGRTGKTPGVPVDQYGPGFYDTVNADEFYVFTGTAARLILPNVLL
jgi:hypothetical protein